MAGVLMVAMDAFNGVRVVENSVRLFVIFVGTTLALLCVRFGVDALRRHDLQRAWGTLSYGLIILTPSVGRMQNFGNPINWVTTGLYVAGLAAGIVALYYRATVSVRWLRRRRREPKDGAE